MIHTSAELDDVENVAENADDADDADDVDVDVDADVDADYVTPTKCPAARQPSAHKGQPDSPQSGPRPRPRNSPL